jgi:hypothetical protein
MAMYPVTDYYKYVPRPIMRDPTFEQVYLTKYRRGNPTLTIEMLETHFFLMQCGVTADDPQRYIDHCDFVHGIQATDLSQEQTITVDKKAIFKLDPAKEIENVGTSTHKKILLSWHSKGVVSGLITSTSNKKTASLEHARSLDFLAEIKKNTNPDFFNRFQMALKLKLKNGDDLNHSFNAKWRDIEEAFENALGHDSEEKKSTFFSRH